MKRFSSRREAVSESFLEERLRSALSYDRIAGDARPGGPAQPTATATRVRLRDGTEHTLALPEEEDGSSWAALVRGKGALGAGGEMDTGATLGDVTVRVSPGMATGVNAELVARADDVPDGLAPEWTRPTVSGRQLAADGGGPATGESMRLCPCRDDGSLAPESKGRSYKATFFVGLGGRGGIGRANKRRTQYSTARRKRTVRSGPFRTVFFVVRCQR